MPEKKKKDQSRAKKQTDLANASADSVDALFETIDLQERRKSQGKKKTEKPRGTDK